MTLAPPAPTKRPKAPKAAAAPVHDASVPVSLAIQNRIPKSTGNFVERPIGAPEFNHERKLVTITDLQIVAMLYRNNVDQKVRGQKNLMLFGPTGCGKTELLIEFCARKRLPMFTVMPAMRSEHLFGQFIEDADGKLSWQKGPLWVACEMGNCVIYFDEINRIHEDIVPSLYPLCDRRRELHIYEHAVKAVRRSTGEYLSSFDPTDPDQERWEGEIIIPVPDTVLIAASYNPGYAGTQQLNEALRNRFEVSLSFDYSEEVEAGIINCKAIRDMGQSLRKHSQGSITTPISTNQLRAFEENIQMFGLTVAWEMFMSYFEDEDERAIVREAYTTKYEAAVRKHFGYAQK